MCEFENEFYDKLSHLPSVSGESDDSDSDGSNQKKVPLYFI